MKIEGKIKKNIPLKDFNTFKIGGEAKYFIDVKNKDDLLAVLEWADVNKQKYYILGGGSNVIAPDNGVDGLVIHLANDEKKVMSERIECGAGATLAAVNSLASVYGLGGLEWSSGIPRATIGGAIRGNAGAFGEEIEEVVENVEVLHLPSKRFELLSKRMCEFEYRNSIFKSSGKYIIWKAILKLKPRERNEIEERIERSIKFRLEKYPRLPSAGSVFENLDPKMVKEANNVMYERELKEKIGREGKIAAGLFIDLAGLKGHSMGGIKVSLEHANHIVNTGKGNADDFLKMVSLIKQQVRDRFKIQLREEVSYFGFDN